MQPLLNIFLAQRVWVVEDGFTLAFKKTSVPVWVHCFSRRGTWAGSWGRGRGGGPAMGINNTPTYKCWSFGFDGSVSKSTPRWKDSNRGPRNFARFADFVAKVVKKNFQKTSSWWSSWRWSWPSWSRPCGSPATRPWPSGLPKFIRVTTPWSLFILAFIDIRQLFICSHPLK